MIVPGLPSTPSDGTGKSLDPSASTSALTAATCRPWVAGAGVVDLVALGGLLLVHVLAEAFAEASTSIASGLLQVGCGVCFVLFTWTAGVCLVVRAAQGIVSLWRWLRD